MYNLTVDDNHTFYVGVSSCLTHNSSQKNLCKDIVNKFPERTLEAQEACQEAVEGLNYIKNKKGGNPVVSIFTHKDGTVSVGISGSSTNKKNQDTAKKLEEFLNKNNPNKYKVSGVTDPELIGIMEQTGKGAPKNPIGQCAEAKAVSVAHINQSEITGMDTRWRFPEYIKENKYPYTGENKLSPSQMDPCGTCEIYEVEYMEFANQISIGGDINV